MDNGEISTFIALQRRTPHKKIGRVDRVSQPQSGDGQTKTERVPQTSKANRNHIEMAPEPNGPIPTG